MLKAKHYGNHRRSLLYGGFLDSTCTHHQESSSADVTSNGDTSSERSQSYSVCSDDKPWKRCVRKEGEKGRGKRREERENEREREREEGVCELAQS